MSAFEITLFESDDSLSKKIQLEATGKILSKPACAMTSGAAKRLHLGDAPTIALEALKGAIEEIKPNQAITLGALRTDLPDAVKVVTAKQLNGQAGIIARTQDHLRYRPGQPGFLLLDHDTKTMPETVAVALQGAGGFWPALASVVSGLDGVGSLVRSSTSAGLYRKDTGERLPGSANLHCFVAVLDASDNERALQNIQDRCWLAGLGWYALGKAGQLLERSIIDSAVGTPERLVFEGGPIVSPPLAQDKADRQPLVTRGEALDTRSACPPLNALEAAKLRQLKDAARRAIKPEAERVRGAYLAEEVTKLIAAGVTRETAVRTVKARSNGVLHPSFAPEFTDEDLRGKTVLGILNDPAAFEGATCADPIEGSEYGTQTAKVMLRRDGTPFINSFAHGGCKYELKHDINSIRAAVDAVKGAAEKAEIWARLSVIGDVNDAEIELLRNEIAKATDITKPTLNKLLKEAKAALIAKRRQEQRDRNLAEADDDPRPTLEVPASDAEWLPQMRAYDSIIGASAAAHPPARNLDHDLASGRKFVVLNTHTFRSETETEKEPESSLPPPEQWGIKVMGDVEAADMIEEHIRFIDPKDGRAVQLPHKFVRHFMCRSDGTLPSLAAVSTLPLVFQNGEVWAKDGFDRSRGIDFHIPPELAACVPDRNQITDADVREAMQFCVNEWLCDVATDFDGKCIIVALALTLIERTLLEERPAFWCSAGRRACGKTTLIKMIIRAVLGVLPAATAFADDENERRKALLAYLMQGVAYLLWDNIGRGSRIECKYIDASCTTDTYSDRLLGETEGITVAAHTIHIFTGNNVNPAGDLGSRSLVTRLHTERHDPENREFKHRDPIGWTDANRARLVKAFYTILLGNPALKLPSDAPMKTRFKTFQRLVGSAVEHAANLTGKKIDFAELFSRSEAGDEASNDLASFLNTLFSWQTEVAQTGKATFKASQLAEYINRADNPLGDEPGRTEKGRAIREFLFPRAKITDQLSAKSVGKALNAHDGNPVSFGDDTLALKAILDAKLKIYDYKVVRNGGEIAA